jgi:hypothetical protein
MTMAALLKRLSGMCYKILYDLDQVLVHMPMHCCDGSTHCFAWCALFLCDRSHDLALAGA